MKCYRHVFDTVHMSLFTLEILVSTVTTNLSTRTHKSVRWWVRSEDGSCGIYDEQNASTSVCSLGVVSAIPLAYFIHLALTPHNRSNWQCRQIEHLSTANCLPTQSSAEQPHYSVTIATLCNRHFEPKRKTIQIKHDMLEPSTLKSGQVSFPQFFSFPLGNNHSTDGHHWFGG
jgi:hypothetical protein